MLNPNYIVLVGVVLLMALLALYWDSIRKLFSTRHRLAIRIAEGNYTDAKIIPAEIARRGEDWQVRDPIHIIYCRTNP